MNSIMALLANMTNPQDEADKLLRLQVELVRIGVRAELRDNNSALMVLRPDPGLPVWVFVGYGGAYYSWDNANDRHPASDPQGTAQALVKYIKPS
ncbi:hypothetical protein [Nonomuraea sp. NEAU-A123]|uniref:hypothetical protein n=1 Tax=Nonomuraea sp. NEAU-A123 TaxID=2839649 RepID=UPI001BE3FDF5|nr:hypothetical protein [Nonomuraea sp. NEAU-A123]MBT2234676.1 hypothetical protein [Nonomuraea sp. NEAU-A123]